MKKKIIFLFLIIIVSLSGSYLMINNNKDNDNNYINEKITSEYILNPKFENYDFNGNLIKKVSADYYSYFKYKDTGKVINPILINDLWNISAKQATIYFKPNSQDIIKIEFTENVKIIKNDGLIAAINSVTYYYKENIFKSKDKAKVTINEIITTGEGFELNPVTNKLKILNNLKTIYKN